jgi:hypothetical protein
MKRTGLWNLQQPSSPLTDFHETWYDHSNRMPFNFEYCEMRIWRLREFPRKAERRVTYPMCRSWNEYISPFEVMSLYNVTQSCGGCTNVVVCCSLAGSIWRNVEIGLNPVRHVLSVVCIQAFVTVAQNVRIVVKCHVLPRGDGIPAIHLSRDPVWLSKDLPVSLLHWYILYNGASELISTFLLYLFALSRLQSLPVSDRCPVISYRLI